MMYVRQKSIATDVASGMKIKEIKEQWGICMNLAITDSVVSAKKGYWN